MKWIIDIKIEVENLNDLVIFIFKLNLMSCLSTKISTSSIVYIFFKTWAEQNLVINIVDFQKGGWKGGGDVSELSFRCVKM